MAFFTAASKADFQHQLQAALAQHISEQRHLWQCLFTEVLRQCRLQLMLEVGLAGCGEERHLWYSAWACY